MIGISFDIFIDNELTLTTMMVFNSYSTLILVSPTAPAAQRQGHKYSHFIFNDKLNQC